MLSACEMLLGVLEWKLTRRRLFPQPERPAFHLERDRVYAKRKHSQIFDSDEWKIIG